MEAGAARNRAGALGHFLGSAVSRLPQMQQPRDRILRSLSVRAHTHPDRKTPHQMHRLPFHLAAVAQGKVALGPVQAGDVTNFCQRLVVGLNVVIPAKAGIQPTIRFLCRFW
jgi:hypothetical protein